MTPAARLDGTRLAADQGMRWEESGGTLTRVTGGAFRVGLVLQAALDQPVRGLRLAAGQIQVRPGTIAGGAGGLP